LEKYEAVSNGSFVFSYLVSVQVNINRSCLSDYIYGLEFFPMWYYVPLL